MSPRAESATEACVACQGTGWIRAGESAQAVARCECLKRRISQERIREILQDWSQYAEADLEAMQAKNLQQIEALRIMRSDPEASYLLSGAYAAGKTYLLVAQFRTLASRGMRCAIRTSKQLCDELKRHELEQDYCSELLRAANTAEQFHLFWDDVEKSSARSDFRAEAVFDLIDTLHRRQLRITLTSNLGLREMIEQGRISSAVGSRLDRMCTKIRL